MCPVLTNVVLLGDINLYVLKTTEQKREFTNILEVYDMKQLIQIATREDNYRNRSSLIDVTCVGKTAKVIS